MKIVISEEVVVRYIKEQNSWAQALEGEADGFCAREEEKSVGGGRFGQ